MYDEDGMEQQQDMAQEQEHPNAAFIWRVRRLRQLALYILVGSAVIAMWVAGLFAVFPISHRLFGDVDPLLVLIGWTIVFALGCVGAVYWGAGIYLKRVDTRPRSRRRH